MAQSHPDDRHKYSPYLVFFAKFGTGYSKYTFLGIMVRRSLATLASYLNELGLAYYRESANAICSTVYCIHSACMLYMRVACYTDLTLYSFKRDPLNAHPSGI